ATGHELGLRHPLGQAGTGRSGVGGLRGPAGPRVEAAGRAAPAGLLYVQLTPPPGSGEDFVDALLAGVRVR
ncbi:hypothetical protein AB0880_32660, partial [Micromonospora chersina]|uniref:hypothetical protein n=1 Tax=Micromonospora chersina TaxID=47854 RepID=UPI003453E445